MSELGLDSAGELRRAALDARAIEAGWPPGLTPTAVQILDLLHAEGPKTRRQICAALGMPWRGGASLRCNNTHKSQLARLIHLGLACRIGTVPGAGGGASKVYSLTLSAVKEVRP